MVLFIVGNGWYLEKRDIFILLILIERAWIIVTVHFFMVLYRTLITVVFE